LMKETEERLFRSEQKLEVEESNEDNQQEKNGWNRSNSYERRPLFCGIDQNDPCGTRNLKASTGGKSPPPMEGRKKPSSFAKRTFQREQKLREKGRPATDEQKETAKKTTNSNEHSLSQTCRTLARPTRQKETVSFPVERTYISPWRRHTQAGTMQKVLPKVLPRRIPEGGGNQAPRLASLSPLVCENAGPVKRERICKQIAVKKNGLLANLTPKNHLGDRSPNVTILRKPVQKNESRNAPDSATGKGINKSRAPNIGCNRSETQALRSARLPGARISTTPLKPCNRKISGCLTENLLKACIENSSSMLTLSRLLPEPLMGGGRPHESSFINKTAQKSPRLAADANRVPVDGKLDEIIFSHEFPKIISDYLKGVGYTQIIAGTMGNAAKQKTTSFVETLCNLVHPIVAEELEVYGKLYCTLTEKKSIIETVIKGFNERVRNSEQWESIKREENEIPC
uniref:Uncharacterized protein n=1 Tax=Parascaris univalens TaxID=6257 RepID=A0A915A2E6_PARUN